MSFTKGAQKNKKFTKLFVALTSTLVLTSCMTGQNTSSELTVYSGRNEKFIGSFFNDFENQSGIKINVRYGDSAELAAQLLEEASNSRANVFISQDAGSLGVVSDAKMLSDLPAQTLNTVESQYQSPNKDWVALTGRARVFAYDPQKVLTPPQSIDDLTDPIWKNKIGIAPTNASFQAFVTALRQIRGDVAAQMWLEKLVANNPQTFEKNSMIVEAIDKGTISLGLTNHYYIFEVAKSLGREINVKNGFFVAGDPGNLVNVSGAGILKTSTNQENAIKLIEFLLSTESQNKFVSDTKEYSVLNNILPPENLPSLKEIGSPSVDLSSLKDVAKTQELLIKVGLL